MNGDLCQAGMKKEKKKPHVMQSIMNYQKHKILRIYLYLEISQSLQNHLTLPYSKEETEVIKTREG